MTLASLRQSVNGMVHERGDSTHPQVQGRAEKIEDLEKLWAGIGEPYLN